MRQAYRFELDPTNKQRSALEANAALSRYAWNWGLAQVKGLLDAGLGTPTWMDLINEWNRGKDEERPWVKAHSAKVPEHALRDLGAALRLFFDSTQRFPVFKRKGLCRDSFRDTYARAVERAVRLPRIGWIKVKESTTKLDGRITSATVSRVADRWFISFAVERERTMPPPRTGAATGLDLGISAFATLSDGSVIPHPKPYKAGLRKLRRLSKEVSRKKKGSANRRKAVAELARHHARVANIRKDAIHKATTELTKTKAVLVLEDLHVRGMVRNHSLARAISDAGWGKFRRQLEYKAEWYGATVIVAPRFMPSSKTCSECGWVKPSLTLGERTFRCEDCGLVIDRDLNAARNLAAVSVPEALNACGGDVRPASTEADADEAGTRQLVTA